MEEKFKIKPLTTAQIIISLDRLTRFKPTEDKYLRVFKDIIISNLISPKFKKIQLDTMDYEELTYIVEEIFKFSLASLKIEPSKDYEINSLLLKYEKSVFKFDKNVQKLLENKIDYNAMLTLFDGGLNNLPYDDLPLNLKWLKSLTSKLDQVSNRVTLGLKFPLAKIILAEGITEEILLPKFAKICGYDFDKAGINLISAGGKNQVVKLFYQFADILKLPMFVLLDNDAQENISEIKPKLRKFDEVHILKGEFEDILPLNLIKRTLNECFRNYSSVKLEDLRKDMPMTKILAEIFKQRGMEFKKAEFASLVSENISTQKDVSPEIEEIIKKISSAKKNSKSERHAGTSSIDSQ